MSKPIYQNQLDALGRRIEELEGRLAKPDVQLGHRIVFSDRRPGEVPASPGGTGSFLRADGSWAIPITGSGGGGGGGGLTSVAHDSTLSGDGTGGDPLSAAPLSGTVAATDIALFALAATKVPQSRNVNGTSPIRINSGGSATLAGDVTVSIDLVVLLAALGIRLGEFGDGSDGDATMDGATAVVGCVLSGSTYFARRECFFGNLTINGGVAFRPDGYAQCVRTALTNNGLISATGGNANGTNGGEGSLKVITPRPLPVGVAGVNGTAGGTGGTNCPRGFTTGSAAGGLLRTFLDAGATRPGDAGGIGQGGGGGAGGNNPGIGGGSSGQAGGSITTVLSASAGDVRTKDQALSGHPANGFGLYTCGSSGGGGASGNPSGVAGGSGGAGGWLVLRAFTIAGSGAIESKGGNGGDGTSGGGGGGGGSGGIAVVLTVTSNQTSVVTGGAGGAGGPGSPGAAGGTGGAGGSGLVIQL